MKKILTWFTDTFGDTWIAKELGNILHSLNNKPNGYSGKKLTIIAIMYCVVKLHMGYIEHAIKTGEWSMILEILAADFSTMTLLFGINVYDKSKQRKDEKNTEPAGN